LAIANRSSRTLGTQRDGERQACWLPSTARSTGSVECTQEHGMQWSANTVFAILLCNLPQMNANLTGFL